MTDGVPQRLRVILVEDNDTDADMVKRLLVTKFDVQRATSLQELLTITRNVEPDVILLDLHLPDGGDYISLVMKVVSRFPQTAIIVITGMDDEMLALETLRAGAQDYMVKEMYVRDQMVKKIRHAHARRLSTAHRAASSMSAPIIDADKLGSKIEEIIEKKMTSRFKTKSGVYETIENELTLPRVARFVRANWKFISGVVGVAGVYLVEVRNTVTTSAQATKENSEAVQEIADALDETSKQMSRIKTQSDERIERLETAIMKVQVTTVKATEHLEEMLQAVSPRTEFPADPPELRQAKEDVRAESVRKELLGE